jgi:uncharacterized protein
VTSGDPIQKTAAFVKDLLISDHSGHDWWHCFRVWRLAKKIWEKEGGNLQVIELAALLHDVGDYKIAPENEVVSENIIREWLEKLQFDERIISEILSIITSISFRGTKEKQGVISIECKIVQDADFLDAIGAIGIGRAFAYGGFKGHIMYDPAIQPVQYSSFEHYKRRNSSTINHFYEKLVLLQEMLNTDTAKLIAESRHKYLHQFLEQFHDEWELRK